MLATDGWKQIVRQHSRHNLTIGVSPFKITQDHWNKHRHIGYLWLPISVQWVYIVLFPRWA